MNNITDVIFEKLIYYILLIQIDCAFTQNSILKRKLKNQAIEHMKMENDNRVLKATVIELDQLLKTKDTQINTLNDALKENTRLLKDDIQTDQIISDPLSKKLTHIGGGSDIESLTHRLLNIIEKNGFILNPKAIR